jgi:gluconokinase
LREVLQSAVENGAPGVLACSALKRRYREHLRVNEQVVFVQLAATPELVERRLKWRKGHFMNPSLLKSQFATIETGQTDLSLDASLQPPRYRFNGFETHSIFELLPTRQCKKQQAQRR